MILIKWSFLWSVVLEEPGIFPGFLYKIIKSKKDTALIIEDTVVRSGDDLNLFSHFFIAGPKWRGPKSSILPLVDEQPQHRSYIDSVSTMDAVEAWTGREKLTFEFGKDVKTYVMNLNSTKLELLTTSGLMEESSVVAAMNNYIYDDDYCVLNRTFNHVGVATLVIYPSLFKARSVALIDHINQWNVACEDATHVHMSYQMIQQGFKLPKKLRTLSTGGYHFSIDCLNYVYSMSEHKDNKEIKMQVREKATGQVLYVDAQEAKTYLASQGWEVVKETAKKVVKEEVAEKPETIKEKKKGIFNKLFKD